MLGLPWHEINFHKETGLFQSETGKLFISTFTFLKVCLKGKLSKGSIKKIVRPIHKTIVTYAKVHNPRSIYISEECMGLYGISDVPGMQLLCLASYQHILTHPLSISNDINVESESVQGRRRRRKYIS